MTQYQCFIESVEEVDTPVKAACGLAACIAQGGPFAVRVVSGARVWNIFFEGETTPKTEEVPTTGART